MLRNSFIILILSVLLLSCNNNKFNVDISNIDLDLNIKRLDKDLFQNYPDTPNVSKLQKEYGKFLDLYSLGVIGIGSPQSERYKDALMQFQKYCFEYRIPEKTDSVFPVIEDISIKLTDAFKHYKYYFSKKPIPEIYTFISAFNQSVVVDEGMIGIALDKYLGRNCTYYKQLGWDQYKIRRMEKNMIPVDVMRALAIMEFPYADSVDNLLNQMVYEGKIQYFLDAMLPNVPDSLKFAYTQAQWEWADYNEEKMWAYLVESETLFSTDHLTIRKFIGDAPFTQVFHNNSCPRAGVFLGWKIVNKYMEKYPDISLKQLMEDNDYQGILNAANYRP
ncbi:MAG: hypothetical protein L3J74_01205 [Bacteroidales bacterium]|nr:hypothetical protein [Bacteroidales bacterium]